MTLLFVVLFGSYFLCLLLFLIGFYKLPDIPSGKTPSKTCFSIIIPFRNEAENLPDLLNSLNNLKYPYSQFEVLLINDASEDNSMEIVKEMLEVLKPEISVYENLRKSESPKKDALALGISISKNDWIITTDADCEVPENWLICYDSVIQSSNPKMICGPVLYNSNGKFIEDFQQLDGLSLQTVTMGSFGFNRPILANGANLGFEKKSFYEVEGFSGNDHLASGDDIFLLEKIKKKFPGQMKFLKTPQALVRTKPQKNVNSVLQQRIRWASKTSQQNNFFSFVIGSIVFLVNVLLLILPGIYFPGKISFWILIVILFLKLVLEFIFIRQSAKIARIQVNIFPFLLSALCYPILIAAVIIGSLRGNFVWKERHYE